MPAKPKKTRIKAAPVQDLIIKALADDCPVALHDRDSFLRSGVLKTALGKAAQKDATPAAVKKSLSRAKSGAIREVLVLAQDHPRVMLPEMGMVAISVSIASLNAARQKWLDPKAEAWQVAHRNWRKSRSGSEPRPEKPEPTQEFILQSIIKAARIWIDEELHGSDSGGGLHLLILDASIVHGSSSFDMLLTVSYRELTHFTRFVREVVQRAEHVNSSQTLQIPFRIGFPKLRDNRPF
jgi:hypothetical protein